MKTKKPLITDDDDTHIELLKWLQGDKCVNEDNSLMRKWHYFI